MEASHKDDESIPIIPDEDMDLVEQALASAEAGHAREMTEECWSNLRAIAIEAARAKQEDGL